MKKSIRILSSNLWHGLDHTKPFLMLPVESPLESYRRSQAMFREFTRLRNTSSSSLDASGKKHLELFCIQEGNPVRRAAQKLSQKLKMMSAFAEANVGLRAGDFSYPFFLQEGLITLWSESLQNAQHERITLSNPIPEKSVSIYGHSLPFSMQLSERRVALIVTGVWEGLRVGVANIHVHHGPPEENFNHRRKSELETLKEHIEPLLNDFDLFFIAGDFNSEQQHAEFDIFRSLHFHEISTAEDGSPIVTWDPARNPICSRSAKLNNPSDSTDPATQKEIKKAYEWDSSPHQFDHILLRMNKSLHGIPPNIHQRTHRIFDKGPHGVWVSDHYGICVDLEWDDQEF